MFKDYDEKVLIIYNTTLDGNFNEADLIENKNKKNKIAIFKKAIKKESENNKKISPKLKKFKHDSLSGTQAHTLGTVISFKNPKNISEQQDIKPNQFNKDLKRKHSLKTKYEQEKKLIHTKITKTKQNQKQSQIITAQFNPKHLLLVVGIDR